MDSWYDLQLPSLGRYYGDKCPDGIVQIRPWTTAQEEEIVRHSENPTGSLIHKVLKNNVQYPNGFSYEDLLGADQHYILMKLRSISITCHYTVDHVCPNCKHDHEVSYNLDDAPVITPDEGGDWDEPFYVTLPKCEKEIGFKHLRVRDEGIISEYSEKKSSSGMDDSLVFRFARKMVSVDGNTNLKIDEKKGFIRNLIMLDFEVFRDAAERKEFGIDPEVKAKCPKCGYIDTWEMPLQLGFFRPKRADIDAAIAMARES